ncbi:16S rRNA (adenine(1518)-N(6)/adenine(1519)-N(6))-dimethyltransferase RsmA [Deltaproteobacteria bacterium OttesenSCG-928-M10]|nr:16S rRNA (adenine(1518)-N(6)/adenine(1519)-N(6))-dimethyltransferase RsmA [Deltaproteobacteria bacterium OttesenSCG-928-M10]
MGNPRVRDTLKDLGLAPSKSRGQNFLKDENHIRRIVDNILQGAGPLPRLLEIGPGLGALTRPLLEAGAAITAVELDRGLAENLGGLAALHKGRLTVIHQDILTVDPAAAAGGSPMFLCGNLPYNISSPVLFWFLRHRRSFSGARLMLQKEMARRLTAGPGSKDYGRLAVALSLWCRVAEALDVPPSAFHPRPKVDSAVVALTPRDPAEEPAVGPEALGRFTAAAFAARRKTILNNLAGAYGREAAQRALAGLDIEPGRRAETLAPSQLAELAVILENIRT